MGSQRLAGSSLASLLVHLFAALLIPALAWTPSTLPPVETISFVKVPHIHIEQRRAPKPQPRPVAPVYKIVPSVTLATHFELAHTSPRRHSSPPPAVSRDVSVAPNVGTEAQIGNGTAKSGEPAPQSTASPAQREVASVGGHSAGGYLPFTAEQPDPVLDPGILKQLDALGVHVTLKVTVGEDGKTKNIVFVPPLDPQIEARIQSLLADASWDPAVCGGGISCEGYATIKL